MKLSRFRPGRAALAFGAGLLAALAHPPFSIWPGLFGWALLLAVLDWPSGPGGRWRAFGAGWLAGFGYFVVSCWWVAEAFFVDAAHQAWMAPFAVLILPAGLGLFWGAATLVYRLLAPSGVSRVLVFAALMSITEWLRGHVLTGFPWDLPGETWRAGSAPSQAASLVGAYGLSFLTLAAMAAFGPLLTAGNRKYRTGAALAGSVLLAALWIGGTVRLMAPAPPATPLRVRIVQPDVPQESKWSAGLLADIARRYANLTSGPGPGRDPDVIVWPEGALPASLQDETDAKGWLQPIIAHALRPGQILLMGTYRAQPQRHGPALYFNSLTAVRRAGDGLTVLGDYDKYRLVPFGEYLPMEPVLGALGVKDWAHVGDGFSPGPRPQPVAFAGLPLAQPLICYEALYPGLAISGKRRAAWIVTVSNDAWFARSTGPLRRFQSGPLQHVNQAAYRAIEQGLPMIRATPTGVSAAIDAFGRTLKGARLGPGESGVIDVDLPGPAPRTLYSRIGDLGFLLLVLLGLAFARRGPGLARTTQRT